jgi:hypothetical protein
MVLDSSPFRSVHRVRALAFGWRRSRLHHVARHPLASHAAMCYLLRRCQRASAACCLFPRYLERLRYALLVALRRVHPRCKPAALGLISLGVHFATVVLATNQRSSTRFRPRSRYGLGLGCFAIVPIVTTACISPGTNQPLHRSAFATHRPISMPPSTLGSAFGPVCAAPDHWFAERPCRASRFPQKTSGSTPDSGCVRVFRRSSRPSI